MKKVLNFFWDVLESLTFAGAIFSVCYLFLFQVSEVHGASSYPTFADNEKIILDKVTYRFSNPQRGDFVIIKSPYNSDVEFLKRVVGLPNEILEIKNCQVFIDGNLLIEGYLNNICTIGGKYKIANDYYFVMGDNRTGSSDSREFGPIPKDKIVGKVVWRVAPLNKFGNAFYVD